MLAGKCIIIDSTNQHLLIEFISKLGSASNTFRYFNNRSLDCLKNHLVTIAIQLDNHFIGYGHLDYENGNIWLGLAVLPKFQSMGYGNYLLTVLLQQSKKRSISQIVLTVDKTNESAINLYHRFNFVIVDSGSNYHVMKVALK